MMKDQNRAFKEYWERVSAPLVLILSFSASLSKLLAYIKEQNLVLVAFSAVIIAVVWVLYVFTQKRPSQIDSSKEIYVFGKTHRHLAIVLLILAVVSSIWTAVPTMDRHKQFTLPSPAVMLKNRTDKDIMVKPEGEFFLSISTRGFTESVLANGKFRLKGLEQDLANTNGLIIPAGKAIDLNGEFLRPDLYQGFFNMPDCYIRFVLQTTDGRITSKGDIPFHNDWLIGEFIYIELTDKPSSAPAPDHS